MIIVISSLMLLANLIKAKELNANFLSVFNDLSPFVTSLIAKMTLSGKVYCVLYPLTLLTNNICH